MVIADRFFSQLYPSLNSSMRQTIAACLAATLLGTLGCTPRSDSVAQIGTDTTASTTESAPDPSAESTDLPASDADRFQIAPVTDNLEHPWGMTWLPNGDILITERPGRLRLIRDGNLAPDPIPGVPDIFTQGQGGLLDIALHPDFAENNLVYFAYSDGTIDANRTHIARATFDGATLSDWEVIFQVSQAKSRAQHFGARLVWLPDGTLLAAIGDGGNPPIELDGEFIRQQAQNTASHLGKVIRINDDGTVPADNPFAGDPDAAPEVWSYGHRNIQGLAIDPETDRIWASEHGARGGDEVNRLEAGANYGWPIATHSREYSGGLISPETSIPGAIDPQAIWTPSIAPSGLMVYRGDRFPDWQGDIFAGGLVSQDIRRFTVDEAGDIVSEDAIEIGQRVRDVRQGPDGAIYVLTDEPNGQLLRLAP